MKCAGMGGGGGTVDYWWGIGLENEAKGMRTEGRRQKAKGERQRGREA